jgi:hypothetical protein
MLVQNLFQYGGRSTLRNTRQISPIIYLKCSYTIKCNFLRAITSIPVKPNQHVLSSEQKIDRLSIRNQSSSTPPSNSTGPSVTSDKTIPIMSPVFNSSKSSTTEI